MIITRWDKTGSKTNLFKLTVIFTLAFIDITSMAAHDFTTNYDLNVVNIIHIITVNYFSSLISKNIIYNSILV